MYTRKGLIIATIAVLTVFIATSALRLQNGIDVLISPNLSFNNIRLGVIATLVVMLVTTIPRAIVTRLVVGAVALALLGLNVQLFITGQLFLLDGMVLLLVVVLLGIAAVEPETAVYEPDKETVEVQIG